MTLSSINILVIIMDTEQALCEAGILFLNTIQKKVNPWALACLLI